MKAYRVAFVATTNGHVGLKRSSIDCFDADARRGFGAQAGVKLQFKTMAHGSTWTPALAAMEQHGIDVTQAVRSLYSAPLFSLARSGLAIGIISRLCTVGAKRDGMRVLPLRSPRIERQIVLMVREGPATHSDVVRDCLQQLSAELPAAFKASRQSPSG